MVHVRSPLFFIHYFSALLMGSGLYVLILGSVDASNFKESWIRTPGMQQKLQWAGGSIFLITLVLLLICCVFELRLAKGWEPNFLRKLIPGCEVVEIKIRRNELSSIFVRTQQGELFEFRLDRDEENLCQVGDVIHLWYIGKYIANIVVISPQTTISPTIGPGGHFRFFAGSQRQSFTAWVLMLTAPVLSGVLTIKGVEHMVTMQATWSRGRRSSYAYYLGSGTPDRRFLVEGGWAFGVGVLFAIAGIGLFLWTLKLWLEGWSDADFESITD